MIVVFQESAESFTALDRAFSSAVFGVREQDDISLALVWSLSVMMSSVLSQGASERLLAEEDHLREALFLDRPYPAFRERVQVRAPRGQLDRVHADGFQRPAEGRTELPVAVVEQVARRPEEAVTKVGSDDGPSTWSESTALPREQVRWFQGVRVFWPYGHQELGNRLQSSFDFEGSTSPTPPG